MIFEISYAIFTRAKAILDQRFVTMCGDSTGLDIDQYALTIIVSTSETHRIDFPNGCIQKNRFFGPKNQFSKFLKPFLPFAPDPIYKNPPVR